ncbi:hypothetical protein Acr_00g0086100 [Actinidia rufa]|uniref:Uncharacterized protein n=1 Tax=Actinidia rufa TaxID=165716 RepID=A0A7J0DVL0_9ERIC|nr:hypothetical protein Acr_00g0086100 [Actinidia rufa]
MEVEFLIGIESPPKRSFGQAGKVISPAGDVETNSNSVIWRALMRWRIFYPLTVAPLRDAEVTCLRSSSSELGSLILMTQACNDIIFLWDDTWMSKVGILENLKDSLPSWISKHLGEGSSYMIIETNMLPSSPREDPPEAFPLGNDSSDHGDDPGLITHSPLETLQARTRRVLKKIGPGGYFNVPDVLDSKTFHRFFAPSRGRMSSSGEDKDTSGDRAVAASGDEGMEEDFTSPSRPNHVEAARGKVLKPLGGGDQRKAAPRRGSKPGGLQLLRGNEVAPPPEAKKAKPSRAARRGATQLVAPREGSSKKPARDLGNDASLQLAKVESTELEMV